MYFLFFPGASIVLGLQDGPQKTGEVRLGYQGKPSPQDYLPSKGQLPGALSASWVVGQMIS